MCNPLRAAAPRAATRRCPARSSLQPHSPGEEFRGSDTRRGPPGSGSRSPPALTARRGSWCRPGQRGSMHPEPGASQAEPRCQSKRGSSPARCQSPAFTPRLPGPRKAPGKLRWAGAGSPTRPCAPGARTQPSPGGPTDAGLFWTDRAIRRRGAPSGQRGALLSKAPVPGLGQLLMSRPLAPFLPTLRTPTVPEAALGRLRLGPRRASLELAEDGAGRWGRTDINRRRATPRDGGRCGPIF